MKTVRFKHVRSLVSQAGVTVAYSIDKKGIRVGLGFCSPKEHTFVKKNGRNLAIRRFKEESILVELNEKTLHKLLFNGNEVLYDVICSFAKEHKISWVKKELPYLFVK